MSSKGVNVTILLRDLAQHFRFQMFKMYEIRLFSYVAGELKLGKKNQQRTFNHLRWNGVSFVLLSDIDLHYQFQIFQIC